MMTSIERKTRISEGYNALTSFILDMGFLSSFTDFSDKNCSCSSDQGEVVKSSH
jgi:hypothetical protein